MTVDRILPILELVKKGTYLKGLSRSEAEGFDRSAVDDKV